MPEFAKLMVGGALAGGLLWLGVTGVGKLIADDPESASPPPAPASTATSSTDSTESPGAPDEPSATPATPAPRAWEDMTSEGGRAFAIHYAMVFNKARVTGRTGELKSLSMNDCEGCRGFWQYFEKVKADGGFEKTGGWKVFDIKERPTNDLDVKSFSFRAGGDWAVFKKSAKAKVIRTNNTASFRWQVHMEWNADSGWLMTRVELSE
jgi:hypothetical protein